LARLQVLSGKEVCAVLRKSGFEEVRRRGSHVVMQKKTPAGTVTVPVPDHAEIRIGTYNRSFANPAWPGVSPKNNFEFYSAGFRIPLFSSDKQLLHQLVPLGVFFFRFFDAVFLVDVGFFEFLRQ
jgi:predicted RNA binding protein YcfA (HicA-like mRNA interferase family)